MDGNWIRVILRNSGGQIEILGLEYSTEILFNASNMNFLGPCTFQLLIHRALWIMTGSQIARSRNKLLLQSQDTLGHC